MIRGIYVPSFTAFDTDNSLDVVRTVNHAEWLVGEGVTGIVPFGTFGEGSSLSLSERKVLLTKLTEVLPDTPFIPTLISNSYGDLIEFLEFLNDLPITAIMLTPPSFFAPIGDQQLIDYYSQIVKLSNHPVIAYNIPTYSLPLSPKVVLESGVWGVKDSSGEMNVISEYLSAGSKVLVGQDALLIQALAAGAFGGIMGYANLFPKQMLHIFNLVLSDSIDKAEDLLSKVIESIRNLVPKNSDFISTIGTLKNASELLGHTQLGDLRIPLPPQRISMAVRDKFLHSVLELEMKH